MAIATFDKFISPRELKIAMDKFGTESFKPVLEAAKQGDKDALNLVFFSCRQVIASAFFKNFLGDKKYWARRIRNGDDQLFASEVYAMLAESARDKKGVLFTFKPEKTKATEEQILSRFQYYMLQYCIVLARNLNRKEKKGGLGGYAKGDRPSPEFVTIKDAGSDKDATDEVELASQDSFVGDYEEKDVANKYLTYLKTKAPKLYDVVLLRIKGASKEEIMKKTGLSSWDYHNYLRKAKEVYQSYMAK